MLKEAHEKAVKYIASNIDSFDSKYNHFPSVKWLAETFGGTKGKGAERKKMIRKGTLEGFQCVLDGRDLAAVIESSEVLGDTSIRPLTSSFRDYTGYAGIIALALGMQTPGQYLNAMREPSRYGVLDDNGPTNYALGLNRKAFEKIKSAYDGKVPTHPSMDGLFIGVIMRLGAYGVNGGSFGGVTIPAEDVVSFDEMNLSEALEVFAVAHEAGMEMDGAIEMLGHFPGIEKSVPVAADKLIRATYDNGQTIDVPKELSPMAQRAIDYAKSMKAKSDAAKPAEDGAPKTAYEVSPTMVPALDALMKTASLPPIQTLISEIDDLRASTHTLADEVKTLKTKLVTSAASVSSAPVSVAATGELPNGEVKWVKASVALADKGIKIPAKFKRLFEFEVPRFDWDGVHRDVPAFDEHYRWRFDILAKLMWGLANNKKPWIHGHTGTGKTTLVEQVCAILHWPFVRINFDSEITRMDLIGRDSLQTDEHGNTITKFNDGILPQSMSGPYVICNDELDFVRSDIAYVYQRSLEDKGLLLTEDGGRLVQPHPMCRMVATANTQGQGDEFGLYQGARVQSQAFLDRFQCWIEVPYLTKANEESLIKDKVPALEDGMVNRIVKYVVEHREAFKQAAILKPMSPRGVISMSEAIAFFTAMDEDKGVRLALEATVLGSVTHSDAAKINELVDRCFN